MIDAAGCSDALRDAKAAIASGRFAASNARTARTIRIQRRSRSDRKALAGLIEGVDLRSALSTEQPLPRRWWQEMQGRHYRCACGAILTTRLSTAWDWPLVFAGAMGVGFGLNFVDLTALESGFAAATLAAVIGWLDRFLFGQPQRAPVGRFLSG